MINKIENSANKAILLLLSGFTYIALFFSIMYNSNNEFTAKNVIPNLFAALAFFIIIFFGFKAIDRINSKHLNILVFSLFAVFVFWELFFLINFSSVPNTDSYRCIDTAIGFATGRIEQVDKSNPYFGYFCAFSNNNMFISILYLYFKFLNIFEVTNFLFYARLLNAVMIFTAVLITYLCVNMVFGKRFASKMLLLLTINPSLYFHIEWVYTLTFSLPFMLAILYLCLHIKRTNLIFKRIILCSFAAVLSAIGFLIRPTAIFPVIAFFVIALTKIKLKKDYFIKLSTCAVSFILVFLLSFMPLSSYANKRFKETIDYNYPITHWIMMGLNDTGRLSFSDAALTESFGDTTEEKLDGNLEEIEKRASEKSFVEFVKHFAVKTTLTFADGCHEIFCRINKQQYYSSAYNYIKGDNNYFFVLYCQGFRVFTYLFMLISLAVLLFSKNKHKAFMPFAVTVLGGFIFYLIWEVKQAYSLPFTIFFLVLATFGMDKVCQKLYLTKKIKNNIHIGSVFVLIAAVLLSVGCGFVIDDYNNRIIPEAEYDYSVRCYDKKFVKSIEANELSQEFYSDKTFNYAVVYLYRDDALKNAKDNNAKFSFTIKNSDNVTIVSKKIPFANFRKKDDSRSYCWIDFDDISSDDYEKYTVEIECNRYSPPIKWAISKSYGIDIYKGNLKISNTDIHNDLILTVGKIYYREPEEVKS